MVTPQRSFWRDKRVFVTGHTGFKGGWLVLWLRHLGAEVSGYALPPPTQPSLFALARVDDSVSSTLADLDDLPRLQQSLSSARPHVVLHLAAQPLVRAAYEDPVATYRTNVLGTLHLLTAARACPDVRAIVNVTTDKCYENREWPWGYRENDVLGGHDPYSSSKACAEILTESFRRSYLAGNPPGPALGSARAGNVIGGGDWGRDRLLPDLFRAIDAGQTLMVRRPHAVRPWQHVLEPLCGYLLLAQRLYEDGAAYAEAWNFGPDDTDARPVQYLVERLVRQWGQGAQWTRDGQVHPHEAAELRLDCSKARTRLGWRPRLALDQALDWTVEWHRERLRGSDLRTVTEQQIRRYAEAHAA